MSRFSDLVSKSAREMGGFFPPTHTQTSVDSQQRLIKLDSDENPFGPSPRALEAMQKVLTAANSYPDDDCSDLRHKLAAHHEIPAEQVLVTAGSTGMLSLLCQTMLGQTMLGQTMPGQTMLAPGLNAVTSQRSFVVYAMAVRAAGAHLIEAPMREDRFDLAAILEAINEHTRLVFLANPNNPTGTMIDAASVDKFIAGVPGHVVVVLDEAYYDFAAHFAALRNVEYSRATDYVRHDASVVVLRTFSKAHGLAGLRVGYGLGPAELLGYCARMRDTFSVSSVAQAAAGAALDDLNHVARTVANNAEQAEILRMGLSELGYRVVPTAANFLYCDVGEEASVFAERLRSQGVSVRPLGGWGAPSCIRVSIGTPEQNQIFLSAVRKTARDRAVVGRFEDKR